MHSPFSAAPAQPQPMPQRHPTFRGQAAGEVVVSMRRASLVALLLPGWPMLVGLGLLGGLVLWQVSGGLPGPAAATLSVPLALATLSALLYWAVTHATPWWFHLAIITNQRVILSQGIVRSAVAAIPLADVQAVEVEQPDWQETLLGYGRVKVASGGGTPITFPMMSRPRAFAEAITGARTTHLPPRRPSPTVADDTLQGLLTRMGQGETLPTMPLLDACLTRDWPLRRANARALPPGETVLGVVSRHWWALARQLGAPLALVAGAGAVALVGVWGHVTAWPVTLALGSAGLAWGLVLYLNFVDDTFVFTTRRIMTVKRRFFIFASDEEFISYDKIQKSEVVSLSLFGRLLRFGAVEIAVSGQSDPLLLDMVPYPSLVYAAVERSRVLAQKRTGVATANRERAEIKEWFAEVLAEMVVATPELRGQPLEDALVRTYGEGMRLVVLSDALVVPGYPPGVVVSQSPSAGSRALRGGDISVMLSRS